MPHTVAATNPERAGEMAHHEHQAAHVDEEPNTAHADSAGEREVHPLARHQLGSRREEHGREEDQEARPDDAQEHLAHRDAGGSALGLGELAARKQREH